MEYLKDCFIKKTRSFKVMEFLHTIDADDSEDAKTRIKQLMEVILKFEPNKKNEDLMKFAAETTDNNYKIFTSVKFKKYWLNKDKDSIVFELERTAVGQALRYAREISFLTGEKRSAVFDDKPNVKIQKKSDVIKVGKRNRALEERTSQSSTYKNYLSKVDGLRSELNDCKSEQSNCEKGLAEDLESFVDTTIEYNNDTIDAIFSKVNSWKKISNNIQKLEKQDLLRYRIIDLVPNSGSYIYRLLSNEELKSICNNLERENEISTNWDLIQIVFTPILKESNNLHKLKKSFDEHHRLIHEKYRHNEEILTGLKILEVYSKQKVGNHNRLTCKDQTEVDYQIHFASPIICNLFKEGDGTDLKWGDSVLEAHQLIKNNTNNDNLRRTLGHMIDCKVNLIDDENQFITNFSLVKISGPPQVKSKCRFLQDKNRIAKGLKYIMEGIYLQHPSHFFNFKKLSLFGVQFYNHEVFIYEMNLPHPGFYSFSLYQKLKYPSSNINMKSQLLPFIIEIIKLKNLINTSKEKITEHIENADPNFVNNRSIMHASDVTP